MKNLCIAIIIVVVVIVVFISFLNQSIHFYKYLQESNVYVDPRSVILNSKFSFRIIYFTHFSCQKFSYNTIFPLSFFLDSWIPSIKKKKNKSFQIPEKLPSCSSHFFIHIFIQKKSNLKSYGWLTQNKVERHWSILVTS